MTVAVTIFDVVWLVAVLVLLWRIAVTGGKRTDTVQRAMIEMVERAQHNNRVSAEAAHDLATVLIEQHRAALAEERTVKDDSPHESTH
jgi:1,4-dihydroxy-2-naphthoate octaprenyltransferase